MKEYLPMKVEIEKGQSSEFPLDFFANPGQYPYRVFVYNGDTITEVLNPGSYVCVPLSAMTDEYVEKMKHKFNLLFQALDIKPRSNDAYVHVTDNDDCFIEGKKEFGYHGFALLAGVTEGQWNQQQKLKELNNKTNKRNE